MLRAVITDLDGTFLGTDSQPLPANMDALRRAAAAGISVAVGAGFSPGITCLLAAHAGKDYVEPGELILAKVDIAEQADFLVTGEFHEFTDASHRVPPRD